MPAVIIIKPAAGLRVLDPATMQPLPPEGAQVEKTSHWIRRIKAGDVAIAEPQAPAVKTVKPASQAAAKE